MKVLGISSSPRANGNSDQLLDKALEAARSNNAETDCIHLARLRIAPCVECNHCYKTGNCFRTDDYQPTLQKIIFADCIIFATPVFFMTVTAQAKLLIDRCQCLWVRKYQLKEEFSLLGGKKRRAMIIAVGGSRSKNMFKSITWTMKTWFDVFDAQYAAGLFVNQVDAVGDLEKYPQAKQKAFELAARLTNPEAPISEEPVEFQIP